MFRTEFHIPKMDCPAEENLIRMKLDGLSISRLDFDLEKRTLFVYHDNDIAPIEKAIAELNLGSALVSTQEAQVKIDAEDHQRQRRILWIVLLINFSFFIVESITGYISKSMGLVADSLDMLADASVYALSLFAVGRSSRRKKNIATIAGYVQITLAIAGFSEVLRRFIFNEQIPELKTMIIVSIFTFIANGLCLFLLQKSKSNEAHMKASMIFTSNDIIINLGVITAGSLVYLLQSSYPDLIIGTIVFILVTIGAIRILKLGK
ncbi:MAG: cation transporter [Bacteroidetes bacterium]|nr:MAG: cation transporter [Bacteroidota bacterium]